MADKNIVDALKQLDPANDDHWTASKQPAVAAVKELHGEEVTREQIDAAADGFNRDTAPGFFMTVGGTDASAKPWEAGDGVAKEIAEASQQPADANAPGSEAASTAENPRAVEALTNDLEGNEAAAVESVGGAEPWNQSKSGEDRPVPVDSPEGQATIADARPEANVDGQLTDSSVADELPGQNADGEISGVRTPAVTYDPRNREDVVTSGAAGDNIDVDDRASGIPSPISEGDFSLHPPTLNPAEPGRMESLDSPRADGASEASSNSEGGEGSPASRNGETEQSEMDVSSLSADESASLETEFREGEEDLAELRVRAGKLQNEIYRAEQTQDMRRNRIDALRPATSGTAVTQAYLARQKKILEDRGAARAALAGSGINLKDLQKAVGKAPIDQAMARKNTRGGHRPTRV